MGHAVVKIIFGGYIKPAKSYVACTNDCRQTRKRGIKTAAACTRTKMTTHSSKGLPVQLMHDVPILFIPNESNIVYTVRRSSVI